MERCVFYSEWGVDHKLVMDNDHWLQVVQAKVKWSVDDLTVEMEGSSYSLDLVNIHLIQ